MIVSWLTTNRCNLKCKHCYQDAGEYRKRELSTDEAKTMIDEIGRAGFKIMIFSGGEPLLRADITALVAYAKEKGLRPVFGTNGMLITPGMAEKLKSAGAAAMGISLDSLDSAVHNEFRGSSDAFKLAVQGMENCRAAGLPFQIHTTVTNGNKEEILRITDYAVTMGAAAHYIFFLVPAGRGKEMEEALLPQAEYETLLENIMLKQQQVPIELKPTCAPQFTRTAHRLGVETRFTRGCLAGLSYCIIAPDGTVRPCAYMAESAGNVLQESFDHIWRHSPVFQTLRTENYSGACGICTYQSICGGCRARASYAGGDYMGEDSYCLREHEETAVQL